MLVRCWKLFEDYCVQSFVVTSCHEMPVRNGYGNIQVRVICSKLFSRKEMKLRYEFYDLYSNENRTTRFMTIKVDMMHSLRGITET